MNLNNILTRFRRALGLKVSYGLRAFAIYIVILGGLGWFLLDHAVERLTDGMRQAAENVMVDSVNVLAALLEQQLEANNPEADGISEVQELSTAALADTLQKAKRRRFDAKIYQVGKTSVSADVYVTNSEGIIVYDSTGRDVGKNYSQWNDVKLTLEGKYGARTSIINSFNLRADIDKSKAPKAMVVAAPIRLNGETLGVVSLATPVNSLERHLATETKQMQETMTMALLIALFLGFVLSIIFSRSINKIAVYVDKMANGEAAEAPQLLDQRLADLTNSVEHLRDQLDGKEYVENYIHSLTHELKTPITGIQGAIELINEGLPEAEQQRFLNNIHSSNQRMQRLVERMLLLAKLESQTELVENNELPLHQMLQRLVNERQAQLLAKQLTIDFDSSTPVTGKGDRVLLSQAAANLIDNAIAFAKPGSVLTISCSKNADQQACVRIENQGELIPDFALPRIYERFFSLPSKHATESVTKSTGLGLSFVKEIMKLHRGNIDIVNTDLGVIATLTWPSEPSLDK